MTYLVISLIFLAFFSLENFKENRNHSKENDMYSQESSHNSDKHIFRWIQQ